MSSELLLELVTIHGTDADTTNTCISIVPVSGVWKQKFDHNFADRPYFTWWSDEENYTLQEQGTMWLCWSGADTYNIDSMLYTPNPVYERLLSLSSDKIHHGMGYDGDRFAKLDFTVMHKQYLILKHEDCELEVIASSDTSNECKEYLRTEVFGKLDHSDVPDYFVVNLANMCFDFSKTRTDKNCFASIRVYDGTPVETILSFDL